MGSCRSTCACNGCEWAVGCRTNSAACCKCIPKRICVALSVPGGIDCDCDAPDNDPYGPALLVEALWDCEAGAYTVNFNCSSQPNSDITIELYYERDEYNECWFILESANLGYINAAGTAPDTRLRLPAGGVYNDLDVRRTNCRHPDYVFDVDVSPRLISCTTAQITVTASNQMARPQKYNNQFTTGTGTFISCYTDCICLTHTDSEGNVRKARGCWDDALHGWHVQFTDSTGTGADITDVILDTAVYADPATVHLDSTFYLGTASTSQLVECERFYAIWDVDDGATLEMERGWGRDCTDCKCICRAVCITYFDGVNVPTIVEATWDEILNGWYAEFGTGTSLETVTIYLACDVETETTTLNLLTSLVTSGSEGDIDPIGPITANCPDFAPIENPSGIITWTLPDNISTISINCNPCGRCQNYGEITECCDGNLPSVLYATFFKVTPPGPSVPPDDRECDGVDGAVIVMIWNPSRLHWRGQGYIFPGCPDMLVYITAVCSVNEAEENIFLVSYSEFTPEDPMGIGDVISCPLTWTSGTHSNTDECCDTLPTPGGFTGTGLFGFTITE